MSPEEVRAHRSYTPVRIGGTAYVVEHDGNLGLQFRPNLIMGIDHLIEHPSGAVFIGCVDGNAYLYDQMIKGGA